MSSVRVILITFLLFSATFRSIIARADQIKGHQPIALEISCTLLGYGKMHTRFEPRLVQVDLYRPGNSLKVFRDFLRGWGLALNVVLFSYSIEFLTVNISVGGLNS